MNKTVLNTITFYLQNKNNTEEVNLIVEILNFTVQFINFWTTRWAFKNLKVTVFYVGGRHHSSTPNIGGDITINKKTGKEVKSLFGGCSICNRKKIYDCFR